MTKIKLYTPVNKDCNYIGFNEIITDWEENGLIERIKIDYKGRFCAWVGRIGGLVLEPSDIGRQSLPYEYALCSQYRKGWENNPKILPWNFFVRNWGDYKKVQDQLPLEKTHKSIFSGTIRSTNPVKRDIWINSTEIFSYRPARTYNRTNLLYPTLGDYYKALAQTRFGLCPCGDIGKCQREVETMGVGCIPIFTPGVETSYFVRPTEGVHYIYADNPQEMNDKINSMSEEQQKHLREEGIKFFNDYCSPNGLWNSVLKTIEKYNIKLD